MKQILMPAIIAAGFLAACGNSDEAVRKMAAGRTFVRDKGGFGGDFTITLMEDGTYQYYEGFLSSYIGVGTWDVDNGAVILTENGGYAQTIRFLVEKEDLVYQAEGSDAFLYVKVEDGDRFSPQGPDGKDPAP